MLFVLGVFLEELVQEYRVIYGTKDIVLPVTFLEPREEFGGILDAGIETGIIAGAITGIIAFFFFILDVPFG